MDQKRKFSVFSLSPALLAVVSSLVLIFFTSCAKKQPQVRIVDLNGNPHHVTTKTPELNNQYIASQEFAATNAVPVQAKAVTPQKSDNTAGKFQLASPYANQGQIQNPQNKNFATNSSAIVEKTFQITPQVSSDNSNPAKIENNDVVQYDLGSSSNNEVIPSTTENQEVVKPVKRYSVKLKKGNETATKSNKKIAKEAIETVGKKRGFYAQVGSFSNHDSAAKTLEDMQKFHNGMIETSKVGNRTLYRVILGPFKERNKAVNLVKKINDAGHEAILVK